MLLKDPYNIPKVAKSTILATIQKESTTALTQCVWGEGGGYPQHQCKNTSNSKTNGDRRIDMCPAVRPGNYNGGINS